MTAEEFKNKVIPYSTKLYPMIFRILKNEEETRDALKYNRYVIEVPEEIRKKAVKAVERMIAIN